MAISFYKEFGELGYLANYSGHSFLKDGILYKTVEHYYQSEKYDNEDIKKRIIEASTPKEASLIGRDRNNIRKDNFKSIKEQVMYDGILEKFRQNRDIAYKLVETRNEAIEEATIDEYYWGIGKDRSGANRIGKILMDVRTQIRKEILDAIIKKCRLADTIYVIGHRVPDADSMFASYLIKNILKSMNINAKMAILDSNYEYASSDAKLINDWLVEEPVVVNEDYSMFLLVDHNNLEGLKLSSVVGAIDHHIISGEVYDTLEMEYSSTCLLIYDLFKDTYKFSEEERKLIYLSVLADTEYLCSLGRVSEDDIKLIESLNINMNKEELQKKYFVINDFSLGIGTNLLSNYKEYNRNGLIKRSIIYSYSEEYDKYFKDYKEYIDSIKDNYLLIWCDFTNKVTYVYYNGNEYKYDYVITSTNVILNDIL